MQHSQIEKFFRHYLVAFKNYNLEKVAACYHLPCTLNTPDNVVLLIDDKTCQQTFNDIFYQLQHAQVQAIKADNASYAIITENLLMVSIDWTFIDKQGQVFTDFCAIYQLARIDGALKIVNVNSHELSNSLTLPVAFAVNN